MDVEGEVARHYTHTELTSSVSPRCGRPARTPSARDRRSLRRRRVPPRLAAATPALARELALAPGIRLLDVGSGIGGPARYFAEA